MELFYLDNNATTQPLPDVVDAVEGCLSTLWANPSSIHRPGAAARHAIELARSQVAQLVGCQEREVLFCSGGTEAANLAILGSFPREALRGDRHGRVLFAEANDQSAVHVDVEVSSGSELRRPILVTSRLEHSAVREAAEAWMRRGGDVAWIPHRPDGTVDPRDLDALLDRLEGRDAGSWTAPSRSSSDATVSANAVASPAVGSSARSSVRSSPGERGGHGRIALVSLMWANNETGVVQPIAEIGALCRRRGVRFHTDATQWVGKMDTDLASMQVDLVSFAAHKFHGPKGIGALVVRRGVVLDQQIVGGPQERDRRGGTENVPGIVGMGVAADAARRWLATDERARLARLRDRLEAELCRLAPGAVVNGAGAERLWNTTNIGFPALEAEAILLLLSERGLCASAGAACSSGSLDPSPVLLAMGVPPAVAHGSIRLSLSRFTTDAEIDRAIEIIPAAIERLSRRATALGR